MSINGFFIIHRKLEADWKWQNPLYRSAWVWLLSRAAWGEKDGLKRGQLRFAITRSEELWGMSMHKARRFLTLCENETDCTGNPTPSIIWERGRGGKCVASQNASQSVKNANESASQCGVITILNYDKYQALSCCDASQPANESPKNASQKASILKEDINTKKNKNTSSPVETPREPKSDQLKKIEENLPEYQAKFPWLNIPSEFDMWQDWMLAKGKTFKNYAAAFRNWCSADWKKPKEDENVAFPRQKSKHWGI